MAFLPTCFDSGLLADFIYWATESHTTSSTIIICHERAEFLQELAKSIEVAEQQINDAARNPQKNQIIPDLGRENQELGSEAAGPPQLSRVVRRHPLRSRTLRILAASSTLNLCFCPSVPVLLAYLSMLPSAGHKTNSRTTANRLLGIVDLVQLHRNTGNFSAQSLGKALAAGVEAAARSGGRLILFETCGRIVGNGIVLSEMEVAEVGETSDANHAVRDEPEDTETASREALRGSDERNEAELPLDQHGVMTVLEPVTQASSFLDEEIPIVSPATKVFGKSADRTFVTRRVSVRTVVGRWCQIESLPSWTG